MKARELRIGNYLLGYDGKVFAWELIDFETVYNDVDVDEICKPIPLTEEWLLKFGFKGDDKQDKYYDVNSACYLHMDRGGDVVHLYDEDNDNELADCKHVHQLQNLYFALTGEELKTD